MEERMATGRDVVDLLLEDVRRYPIMAEALEIDSPQAYTAGREILQALRALRQRSNATFVGADSRREIVLGHLIDAEGTVRGKMHEYLDREPE